MNKSYDYKFMSWKRDYDSFVWWRDFYGRVSYPDIKQRALNRCVEIQKRWPQYIKVDELPS